MRDKTFYRKFLFVFCAAVWLVVLSATLACGHRPVAKATPPPPQAAPAPRGQTSAQGEGGEYKISPAEAQELFRSVDEILKFASTETLLPIRRQVTRRLTSRDEVVSYIQKHMEEDEDAQRLRRSELVLKKFGLLPRDFNLQTFLLALLREQVAGYYDPKTKTVNLLNWIDAEQQKPVLAHELTHALQDQSFGLEKWMKSGVTDLEKTKQPTPADIENDEATAARQAVVEGQAHPGQPRRIGVAAQGQRRHLQDRGPSLAPLMEQGQVSIGYPDTEVRQQFTALVEGEIQVTVPDFGQLAGHPQPVLPQGRDETTGQHQLDGLGWPALDEIGHVRSRRSGREMEVVHDDRQARRQLRGVVGD